MPPTMEVDVVFDGPPGPVAGRFVEVENMKGHSINAGQWVQRPDGFWALRLTIVRDPAQDEPPVRCREE